jgi:hypothetical protein
MLSDVDRSEMLKTGLDVGCGQSLLGVNKPCVRSRNQWKTPLVNGRQHPGKLADTAGHLDHASFYQGEDGIVVQAARPVHVLCNDIWGCLRVWNAV